MNYVQLHYYQNNDKINSKRDFIYYLLFPLNVHNISRNIDTTFHTIHFNKRLVDINPPEKKSYSHLNK